MKKNTKFSDQIKKEVVAIKQGNERTMRGVAIALFGNIIKDSVVLTGRFRGNWFFSGRNGTEEIQQEATSEAYTVQRMQGEVLSFKDWSYMMLTNNLPYASIVEYGRGKRKPTFVVRNNVALMEKNIELLK